jgi:hypothetical protein
MAKSEVLPGTVKETVTRERVVPVLDDDPDPKIEDFFGYLKTLTPSQWSTRTLYIYRQPGESYISKVVEPVDEAWLQEHFGGGDYKLWLKSNAGERLLTKEQRIAGPSKNPPVNGDGQPNGAAGATAAGDTPVMQLISALREELVRRGSNPLVEKGAEAGMHIMESGFTNVLTCLTTAMAQMKTSGADPGQAMIQGFTMAMQTLVPLFQQNSGQKASITETLDMIKTLREAFPQPAAGGDGWSTLIANALPQALNVATSAFVNYRMAAEANLKAEALKRGGKIVDVTATSSPANGNANGAASPTQPTAQLGAEPAVTQEQVNQAAQAAVIAQVEGTLAHMFKEKEETERIIWWLEISFPLIFNLAAGKDLATVSAFMKQRALLKDIPDDPRGPALIEAIIKRADELAKEQTETANLPN